MFFSAFNITPDLLKGIEEAGYAECTTVQEETLQHTLEGRDVFVQSQTGTGKTAAFLISLFELFSRSNERERAIIITPTRELAVQIAEEAKLLSLYLDFNIVTVFGGVGYVPQIKAIKAGVDILIGTPGRIIDMSNKKMLHLNQFNYAVIDEADRMFDMGFVNDIQTILNRLPSRTIRQTMLFSATLSSAVKRLASGSMNEPAEVHIAPENITVEAINQQLYHVGSDRKIELLLGILKRYAVSRTLIFVNMKHIAEELVERLIGNGFNASYLTGDLPQRRRLKRIDMFKNNELPILVATDVAARGIHVDDLELVINYDIPMHNENYVHRIGRTARAGKSGHAITLACENFVEFLAPIEAFIKMKIPSSVAEEELYLPDATAGKRFIRSRRSTLQGSSQRSRSQGKRSISQRRQDGTRKRSTHSENHPNRKSEKKTASTSNNTRRRQYKKRSEQVTDALPHHETNGKRSQRKNDNGRIPQSHVRDRRNFEKQQHPPEQQIQAEKKHARKKGLFAKVISFFK